MRYIKVELPDFYKGVVTDVMSKYPNASKISREFFEDLLFIISFGYDSMWRHLIGVGELLKEVSRAYIESKIKNMRKYEAELFNIRLDLIDFADSGFARALKDDPFLKLEEKFEFVVMTLDAMCNTASGNSAGVPQEVLDEMEEMGDIQEGAGQEAGGSSSGGPSAPQTQGDMAITSQFFKGFSFLVQHMFGDSESKMADPKAIGQGYGRGASAISDMYKETLKNKFKISDLVNKLWNESYMQMFDIARNIDFLFSKSKTGKLVESDAISSNITTARMSKFRDVNRAVRMELALADTLDRKVMNKTLKVYKFRERKDKKQLLYALLDRSGSTMDYYNKLNINRLNFIKAVAIALGKKAVADNSKFFFRWFESNIQDMYTLEHKYQWSNFLSHILNVNGTGGTNIDLALHVAAADIEKEMVGVDKSDIIVITDGTTDVAEIDEFIELKKKGVKFHFICLEQVHTNSGKCNIEKLAETFQIVDLDKVDSLHDYKPEFRKVI